MAESKLPRYSLAHFLNAEDGLEGVKFTDWPLHLTVVPWFRGADEWESIRNLEFIAEQLRVCAIALGKRVLGSVELYGPDADVPVRPTGQSTGLGVAHGLLLARFLPYLVDRTYVGDNYNPHVTVERQDPGENFTFYLDGISLIRHDGTHKTIVANHKLKE